MRVRMLAVFIVALGMAGFAQEIPPREYFEVPDLQLISHEAVLDGTVAYSGPTCAAIVLAWFAEHGYPAFLPDLTEDGVVDERDTVKLAEELAPQMRVEPDQGALDPRLVDTLARYVSERYPDQFLIKLYDDTFREEYRAVMGRPFAPELYPHVAFELRDNATHADYTQELLSAEGVILGLGRERERNRYFVGRSFRFQEQPEGWPVDVVDTSDDPGQPGIQGQVFPTYMREGERHWLVAYGGWQPLEFMLTLSPIREPGLGEQGYPCAEDAFGYDVTTVDTEHGSFQVEECAVHDGDRDLYVYTVTNIDFLYEGCGLCEFFLPNIAGIPTLDQWGPPGWLMNAWFPPGWSWTAPLGSCGIMPGESAVFGIAVPAPTMDVARPAAVFSCVVGPAGLSKLQDVLRIKFTTTGPEAKAGCPDLVIIRTSGCWYIDQNKGAVVQVEVWLKNGGTETAHGVEVCVGVEGTSVVKNVGTMLPGAVKHETITVTLPPGSLPPFSVNIELDCHDDVEECDETNNTAQFTVERSATCR